MALIERAEDHDPTCTLLKFGETQCNCGGMGRVRNSVTFTLAGLVPPSVNSLYSVNFKPGTDPNRRIMLKEECRRWVNEASGYVPRFKIADTSVIRIDRTYYFNWFTKMGKWAKRDVSNFDKLLFDMIAKRIQCDDSRFKSGMMHSVNCPNEKTVITLSEVVAQSWSEWS